MQFTDAVTVEGKPRRTADGYLIASAKCVRTGIQIYTGDEVGKPEMDKVRVYRAADQVFAQDSLQSFSHAPITVNHPTVAVTADNWKELAVGEVSTAAKQDGVWVSLPLIFKDASAIASLESGKRELSAGYVCELDFTPGSTADGQPFDAQQRSIKINHLALVDRARAGSEARISDGVDDGGKDRKPWGAAPILPTTDKEPHSMSDALRTVIVDGLSVSTTDQGAQAITTLLQRIADAATKAKQTEAAHTTAIAAKDTEVGGLKADLKKAQDSAIKAADLDKMVADRAALVSVVKTIDAKIVVDGKSDTELRKAAVTAKLGAEMVKDASDAEIAGMFKAIAKDVKAADPFADALKGGLKHAVGDAATQANDAFQQSVTDLNAWRKEA